MGENKPLIIFSAGGFGTRMQSLNAEVPKPMIAIGGKPILQWGLESLVAQGYVEYIITVSYKAEVIINYFGNGDKFGCHISYYIEREPLGNAGALYKLWESGYILPSSSFFFFIADAIFDVDIIRFWNYHILHKGLATLLVHPNSHPYDSGLVIVDKNNTVCEWLNKEDARPKYYRNIINSGLHILTSELLVMSGIKASDVGTNEGQIKVDLDRDVLKPLISTNRVIAYPSTEYCKDAGIPERFYSVEKDIKRGMVRSRMLNRKQRAIFLDLDGTINVYKGFLGNIDEFELLPGVAEAIKLINVSGYLAIVITYQPVTARGEVLEEELQMIHKKMETLLGEHGAYIDGMYFCPYHPDKGYNGVMAELMVDYDCQKPDLEMILNAAKNYNIDLSQSWMVGDSKRDIQTGINAGCKTVLLYGKGTEWASLSENKDEIRANYKCYDLLTAVNIVLPSFEM